MCLSTIGAQATQPNLLNQLRLLEQALTSLASPVTFLRPAWFMENALWDVEHAMGSGMIPSFLQPLDKPVPMIATADVGRVAAELLQVSWQGKRIVELEGPQRITPLQLGAGFSELLGKPVRMQSVPRETWQALFESQGMRNPLPRIQMIDGFNEGWIEFEGVPRKGRVELLTVLERLLSRHQKSERADDQPVSLLAAIYKNIPPEASTRCPLIHWLPGASSSAMAAPMSSG
ncbi:Rossmann-fold NAD(P)-binding domain-containing protein [Pseudomonas sp. LB3P14]